MRNPFVYLYVYEYMGHVILIHIFFIDAI